MAYLDFFFYPKEVAVIGASHNKEKVGYTVVKNLKEGFKGEIYPVNPKGGEILGLKVYKDVYELPESIDLAVITVPRDFVLDVMKKLADKKVKGVIIITAGFKEMGKEGYLLEEKIKEIAQKNNIAVLGPNCLGLINTSINLNATFAGAFPAKGNIAFFSQSGALGVAILDWSLGQNIGFSKFISLGNKAVLNESHMLKHLSLDKETSVILGYIENVVDGKEFLREATLATQKKPVIMIKSGTSAAGARAASSHTGAIAGSESAYQAAFEKAGIIRVFDVETLFELAQAFASQPLPKGPNLAIITNSGGPGIMATDACEKSRLHMAKFSEQTIKSLQENLPSFAAFYNPVDILGDADISRIDVSLRIVGSDSGVDSILLILTPTATLANKMDKVAEAIIKRSKEISKPLFVCLMGKNSVAKAQNILIKANIPCYNFPEPAIRCIESMYLYMERKRKPKERIEIFEVDKLKVKNIIEKSKSLLSTRPYVEIVEFEAQGILEAYNIPYPKSKLARTSKEAAQIAEEIGFPVVLKIASKDISHKSDVGGVKVGLKSKKEVEKAFLEITSRAIQLRPDAYITGCLVQQMAPHGSKEVIVGFKRDDQFGPLLMFGLGGIYVEVLKDVSFKLAPVTRQEAFEMIRSIKSYMLLKGVRGEVGVKIEAIVDIILKMSQFALDFPEVTEAEFNPVLVDHRGALVADARMVLHS